MNRSALQRAQRLSGAKAQLRLLSVIGVLSASLVPLLVVDFGLLLQLLVSRGASGLRVFAPPFSDHLMEGGFLANRNLWLVSLAGISVLLVVLEGLTFLWLQRRVHRYSLDVASFLRKSIYAQTFVLGPLDLLGGSWSQPEELFLDRVGRVRDGLISWWTAVPRSAVQLALLLLVCVAINFWLTLLAVLLTVYILRFYRSMCIWCRQRSAVWEEEQRQLASDLQRAMHVARLAPGYSLKQPQDSPFAASLARLAVTEMHLLTCRSILVPVVLMVTLVALAFILLVVGLSSEVTVAGTILLGTTLFAAYFPALRLYRLPSSRKDAERAAGDIFAYLDREPSVRETEDAASLERLSQEVRLDAVTIANREGVRLLHNVSFSIRAGSHVGIVATNRQLPMALAGLFVRFYDPAAGQVLFDGQDIRRVTLETVRGQAMLVAAEGPLFPTTVQENVVCGESGFTPLQISDALKQARADAFIRELPEGLSTIVDGQQVRLSADQAFRIGLARALLREPSLLIMQEPDGDFPEAVAEQLDGALADAARGRTAVVLPSRLSTLRRLPEILLFHEGQLVARGTHSRLLQDSELYRHVNYLRFTASRFNIE